MEQKKKKEPEKFYITKNGLVVPESKLTEQEKAELKNQTINLNRHPTGLKLDSNK